MPKTVAERKRLQRKKDQEDPERKHRKLDTIFMFGCVEVAVIVDLAGDIWFKGVDLARALEMEDPTNAVALYINKDACVTYEQLSLVIDKYRDIPGMHPSTTFVNEAGMYRFVLRSRMPKAEAFTEWVCAQVLPSIRRTGKYEIADDRNPLRELNEMYIKHIEHLNVENAEYKKKDTQWQQTTQELYSSLIKQTDLLFSIKPKCVPDNADPLKQEILMIISKNLEPEMDDGFPLYASRIQQAQYRETAARLKTQFPDHHVLREFETPNAVNLFNYIFDNMPGLERKRDEKHRGLNSFRLRPDYSLDKFLAALDNLYRTTYFVDPNTAAEPKSK